MPATTYRDDAIRAAIHTALTAALPSADIYDGAKEFQTDLGSLPMVFVIHTGMDPAGGPGLGDESWTYGYQIIAEMPWPTSGTVETAESGTVDDIVTALKSQPEPFGGVATWRRVGRVQFDEQPGEEQEGSFYRVFVEFSATAGVAY